MKLPPEFNAEERLSASWIKKMGDGEVEALNALYSLYHRPLLSLFSAILKDDFETEEVLQDTFVRAYRDAKRFDPELGVPFAWLVTIGKRLAFDRLRRRRSRPNLTQDIGEHPGDSVDKEGGNAQSKVHQNLEHRWIRDCLQALSETQKETIELAFYDGYTHNEISEKLDKPLGTVKSDLRRGMMMLRKAYLEGDD